MYPKPVVLTITLDQGRVNVNGPLGDKVFCYGLLEAAKDAIRDYQAPVASGLVIPGISIPPGLVNGGKGA